ncbi:MAG TPA: hypothetical protein VN226_00320 [Anaerolineales bacterium]|nr:hypothetical protein [Anaerolineales bacterium]
MMTKSPYTDVKLEGKDKPLLVAVIANIKEHKDGINFPVPGVADDISADFDHIETINAIRAAIETDGHQTVFLQANRDLPYSLKEVKPDICFNIAEGLGGDAREAQVPALLELLRIPYTGSRVMANAISLDKTLTKRIWRDRNLPVAPFQEFIIGDEKLRADLKFPLFIKPAKEGTGMGVDTKAIIHNYEDLMERIQYLLQTYKQPALVEKFLNGREFTCGIIGRWDSKKYSRYPDLYNHRLGYHLFPILELESEKSVTPGLYSNAAKSLAVGEEGAPTYTCPAQISAELERKIKHLVVRAHMLVKAIDYSRVDLRLDDEGNPNLIEINTLPGLTPDYSDLCLEANAEGISYTDLILEILYLGASRWGLLRGRELRSQSKPAK